MELGRATLGIMSTQTATFTIQDLALQAAKVIEAVHRFGSVDLRMQDGETLELKTKPKVPTSEEFTALFKARRQRLRELGGSPMPASENERVNKIIAGEL